MVLPDARLRYVVVWMASPRRFGTSGANDIARDRVGASLSRPGGRAVTRLLPPQLQGMPVPFANLFELR